MVLRAVQMIVLLTNHKVDFAYFIFSNNHNIVTAGSNKNNHHLSNLNELPMRKMTVAKNRQRQTSAKDRT
jgi:hypothetical protein